MKTILLFFATVMLVHLPANAASHKNNGWLLDQVSEEFGRTHTELTHDALRLQTEEFTVFLQGPKYEMSIVNNKTRRYLIPANYNFHDYAENFKRFFDLEKGNTETIFSVKATRYLVRKRINKALTVEFLTTEGLNTTKGLNDAIAIDFSMSEMPPGHGFLLQCVKFKPSGVKYRFIDTTSIKPAYIPPSTFIRPKNYEKVAGFVELQASKRIPDKDVNSLFKEPDDRISAPHRKPAN